MRRCVVPWLNWDDVRSQSTVRKPVFALFWLTDKIGYLLEQTPLCVIFCSFWINRYLMRARCVIQSYQDGECSRETCEHALRRLDRKLYGYWLVALGIAAAFFFPLSIMVAGSWTWGMIAFFFLYHECACPSSLRHHAAAIKRGDTDLARMNERASPSTLCYFRKYVLGESVS